jgi:hypothetical protein
MYLLELPFGESQSEPTVHKIGTSSSATKHKKRRNITVVEEDKDVFLRTTIWGKSV